METKRHLTLALAKGRLSDQALDLLDQAGLDTRVAREGGRKLILRDEEAGVTFIMAKPADVPTYVEYGAADLGFVGKDTILEENRQLYEVLDLKFGACKLAICGPEKLRGKLDHMPGKRVATKYPNITRRYYADKKRESVEVIKLNGSIEIAPLIGLSDVILDIVESGRTLKENNLVVLEDVAQISARLVVNRVSMKIKADRIQSLIKRLRHELTA